MDEKFPFKYAFFTNNHVLDEERIQNGQTINYKYNKEDKLIELTEKRLKFTDEKLDYTCVQIFEKDGIQDYFKIDPNIKNDYNNQILKDMEIFILQYPEGENFSFSNGTVISYYDIKIRHNASTKRGSSGSPIIKRCINNYIIGIHCSGFNKTMKINNKTLTYNLAVNFKAILEDIKKS